MRKFSLIVTATAVALALTWVMLQTLHAAADRATEDVTPVDIIDLGTLGGSTSTAVDIDNTGRVAGTSTTTDDLRSLAFTWLDGEMAALTTPEGYSSTAVALNDNGRVVGTVISQTSELSATHTPVLWAGEFITNLAAISATQVLVADINTAGLMVGQTISDTANDLLIWQPDATLSSTIPFSPTGTVTAINDAGAIVGTAVISSDLTMHGFIWQDGVFTDLGTLGGTHSAAHDINQFGQIVGTAAISDDLAMHAFIWQDGIMTDLGRPDPPPAEPISALTARGINSAGIVVGDYSVLTDTFAFVWQNGLMTPLDSLLPEASGWERLSTAVAINDNDWIVGTGIRDGAEHAYLLKLSRPISTVHLPVVIGLVEEEKEPTVDVGAYLVGDGRLYEVRHSHGSQARHQTQFESDRYYHTKGNEISAEWEELWNSDEFIYRGTDTSPGGGNYYTLYEDGVAGSKWAPRNWAVGDIYERNPYVVFYDKATCSIVASGYQRSWLKFMAVHDSFTFDTGITVKNVVQLAWLLSPDGAPEEEYFYSADYGLVGWGSRDRGYSAVSEVHQPGARPDNNREIIGCRTLLETDDGRLKPSPALNNGPLPEGYRAK